ncbi:protein tyrosine phosphatase, partial [Escherichia coli]|nr:protein tyrosine phosphatase [Escherichia coli]
LDQFWRVGPEARGNTMLFGHWLNLREIPDPFRKSNEAFLSVYKLIEQAGGLWAQKLGA